MNLVVRLGFKRVVNNSEKTTQQKRFYQLLLYASWVYFEYLLVFCYLRFASHRYL